MKGFLVEESLNTDENLPPKSEEPKKRSAQSQAEKFSSAEKIITKGQLHEVSNVMESVGYPAAEVKKAEPLLQKSRTAIVTKDTLHGIEVATKETVANQKEVLYSLIPERIKYAKIAFANNLAVRDSLKLDEERKESVNGFIEQSTQFYTTIFKTPEWITPLKQYSITEDILHEDFRLLNEYKAAIIAKEKAHNDSVEATRLRDEALKHLFDWVKKYKQVAKIALKPYPHLLALLGIK